MTIATTIGSMLFKSPTEKLAIGTAKVSGFERFSAGVMTMFGVHLLIWPQSLKASRFHSIGGLVTPQELMLLCLVFGMTWILAIVTAGQWKPWCAHVRAICAAAGGLLWSQMGFALIMASWPEPSIGIWIYFGAALCDGIIVVKALRSSAAGARGNGP